MVEVAQRPPTVALGPARFEMGNPRTDGYPADGEVPVHPVTLDRFGIGVRAVTNDEFSMFVAATGYRTTAEQYRSSFVFAGLLAADHPPTAAVEGAPWWRLVDGADWRHPEGPATDITDRGAHPVVHVSWIDAAEYSRWVVARLPTEAEWEYAARGGLVGQPFPWGDELEPDGEHRMNVFQGTFPTDDTGADGWRGTSPVGAYPPNAYGLFATTGNVWEWCADWSSVAYYQRSPERNPAGPDAGTERVLRGGSYLCHESYCNRYRVDARSRNAPDSSAGNIGFRIAIDPEPGSG